MLGLNTEFIVRCVPLREWFAGSWYATRRQFTRFGPKTTVILGPFVIWIYWEGREVPHA